MEEQQNEYEISEKGFTLHGGCNNDSHYDHGMQHRGCCGDCGKGEPSTITFKYQEGKSGKELADEFSKSYGGAQIEDREDFMYVENVKSFYIEKEPEDSAKGPFNIAFTRDYKDGGFSMEVLEKHCGDEMDDMNTSDMIGLIMGSIKFDK